MDSRPHPKQNRTRPIDANSAFLDIERLELIDGELIDKQCKRRPHSLAFRRMLVWLQQTFGNDVVEPEASIDVSPGDNPANEPQPDLIVLNRASDEINVDNPQPRDIVLLIEIPIAPLAAPAAAFSPAQGLPKN